MSGGKSTNLGVTSIRMGGYDSEHYSSLIGRGEHAVL